jgi:hypothetical protein
MVTTAGSEKVTRERKLFKPSAQSFLAAADPEDSHAARPRRSLRRDSPPSCRCGATPLGCLDIEMPVDQKTFHMIYPIPPN